MCSSPAYLLGWLIDCCFLVVVVVHHSPNPILNSIFSRCSHKRQGLLLRDKQLAGNRIATITVVAGGRFSRIRQSASQIISGMSTFRQDRTDNICNTMMSRKSTATTTPWARTSKLTFSATNIEPLPS
ncbi:hypothetical protein K470DRAFT_296801 [Piedraia hortae CBS 480.64]|uniref:Uncharacterized protein n=1 Tax=Piedraia hortae CBS 480.64 TaxID=1314780 RepID=A0A6A7BS21_9PEZI|nr:hypothetical protein K470DRAFT_296801 [Piedraia hortae CBS 480.64]